MRRPPAVEDARAGLWAWRALRSARAQLRAGAVRDVRVPEAPRVPSRAGRSVRLVLSREEPSCLERALVLQRWLVEHGLERDVIVGVTGREDFRAHAWLEGESVDERFQELTRLRPPKR